jgi:hypothetical protein
MAGTLAQKRDAAAIAQENLEINVPLGLLRAPEPHRWEALHGEV